MMTPSTWSGPHTSADMVTISPHKDVEILPRVPIPKKSDLSILSNDWYRVLLPRV